MVVLVFILFLETLYLPYSSGREKIKISTPSANEPAKYLILVLTVQLKPMIKTHISGIMVYSGISDVATTLVHSEKTRLKKLMKKMIIIIIVTGKKEIWDG